MIWNLILAHLLADYPLQPAWMVRRKTNPAVLLLHVTIHLIVMLLVTLGAAARLWPYLAAVAAVHYGIDAAKNAFTTRYPHWITWPYLVDQALHFLSLGLAAYLIGRAGLPVPGALWLAPRLAVIAAAFVLVTFTWRITERVLRTGRPLCPPHCETQPLPRMLLRAALLAVLLLAGRGLSGPPPSLALLLPYPATRTGARLALTDFLLTAAIAAAVMWVNRR